MAKFGKRCVIVGEAYQLSNQTPKVPSDTRYLTVGLNVFHPLYWLNRIWKWFRPGATTIRCTTPRITPEAKVSSDYLDE
jgi:hypothetical protein